MRNRDDVKTRSDVKKRRARPAALTLAVAMACAAAAVLGGCSGSGADGPSTIGVLFPATGTGRFGSFDKPLIEQRIKEECPTCRVEVVSAADDTGAQRQQIIAMINEPVDVMILGVVDAPALRSSVIAAHQAGIPVVAYDRLAEGPISGYVTFDGIEVGRLQGEGLLKAIGGKAQDSQIVMMNGDSGDPNSALFKQGALSVLTGKVKIGRSYDTVNWQEANAYANMTSSIAALGANNINGVVVANDNLATGVLNALKAARITPLPPLTGQDADLDAVQRLVTGEQYMTVYKPFKPEAYAAADMAIALMRGQSLNHSANTTVDNATTQHIPTVLLKPVSVTVGNIKGTIVKDGMYTVGEICTPDLQPACTEAGLL
jgi:ABC-type xylose transport system substrate-binding protein